MSDVTANQDLNLETRPELEVTTSVEKDSKGIGYITIMQKKNKPYIPIKFMM